MALLGPEVLGMGGFRLGREIDSITLYMASMVVHILCIEKQAVRILGFVHIPWETIKVIPVQCLIFLS